MSLLCKNSVTAVRGGFLMRPHCELGEAISCMTKTNIAKGTSECIFYIRIT